MNLGLEKTEGGFVLLNLIMTLGQGLRKQKLHNLALEKNLCGNKSMSSNIKRDHYHDDAMKRRNVRMSVSADGYDQRWKLWDSKIFFSGGLECNY